MNLNIKGLEDYFIKNKFNISLIDEKFELAAIYELAPDTIIPDDMVVVKTNGKRFGIVYFGNPGSLYMFPFIQLIDDGIGLSVNNINSMSNIWIIVWNYDNLFEGKNGKFENLNINLNFKDEKIQINPDTRKEGNVCVFLKIENVDSTKIKLINISKTGTLKQLTRLEQLINIINS